MGRMEEALARQLANQKISDERRKREIEKLCGESDELKELQAKIKAAYLNKERNQQMTEKQYRIQTEIVSHSLSLLLTLAFATCRSKTPKSTSPFLGTKRLETSLNVSKTSRSLTSFGTTSGRSRSRSKTQVC